LRIAGQGPCPAFHHNAIYPIVDNDLFFCYYSLLMNKDKEPKLKEAMLFPIHGLSVQKMLDYYRVQGGERFIVFIMGDLKRINPGLLSHTDSLKDLIVRKSGQESSWYKFIGGMAVANTLLETEAVFQRGGHLKNLTSENLDAFSESDITEGRSFFYQPMELTSEQLAFRSRLYEENQEALSKALSLIIVDLKLGEYGEDGFFYTLSIYKHLQEKAEAKK
jgi:hypothetical protein